MGFGYSYSPGFVPKTAIFGFGTFEKKKQVVMLCLCCRAFHVRLMFQTQNMNRLHDVRINLGARYVVHDVWLVQAKTLHCRKFHERLRLYYFDFRGIADYIL